ncbi:MAG: hypothetical protein ACI8WM_000665 [Burkholderiaceae bacterium]
MGVACLCLLMILAPVAQAQALISFAEKPVQVIRGTELHTATVGAHLDSGDLLASAETGVQITGLGDTVIALGPASRIAYERRATSLELALLEGWLKVQIKGADQITTIQTARLRVRVSSGTLIVHAGASSDEVFVENGTQTVAELDRKRGVQREITLEREQFAARSGDEPLKAGGRPGRQFIDEMPRTFRDVLVPVVPAKNAKVALKKEHAVRYDEIGPWLESPIVLQQSLVRRFVPRLKDPAFRQSLDTALGQSSQWKPILHPPPPAIPKKPG